MKTKLTLAIVTALVVITVFMTARIFRSGNGYSASTPPPAYFPVAAQWDNVAITKSVNFVAPQSSVSTATLRPLVRITSPASGAFAYASGASLTITADATDLDGTITNVQFFAGTNKVGEVSASPWTALWSNIVPGSHILTAVAADNAGAAFPGDEGEASAGDLEGGHGESGRSGAGG